MVNLCYRAPGQSIERRKRAQQMVEHEVARKYRKAGMVLYGFLVATLVLAIAYAVISKAA